MSVTKGQYDLAKGRLVRLRQAISQMAEPWPSRLDEISALDDADGQWDAAAADRHEPAGDLGRCRYCLVLVEAYTGNGEYEIERRDLEEFDTREATAARIEEWVFEDLREDYAREAFAIDSDAGKVVEYTEIRRIEWVDA